MRSCANFEIVNDDVVENMDERFTVVISNVQDGVQRGDRTSTNVTIVDDDCEWAVEHSLD